MLLSPSFTPNSSTLSHTLCSSSSSSVQFLFLKTHKHSNNFRTLNLRTSSSSYQTIEIESEEPQKTNVTPKKKQKLRPSFYEQVRHRWSLKNDSQRQKFPWQEQEQEQEDQKEEEEEEEQPHCYNSEENGENPLLGNPVSFSIGNRLISAPWINRSNSRKPHFEFVKKSSFDGNEVKEVYKESKDLKGVSSFNGNLEDEQKIGLISAPWIDKSSSMKPHFDYDNKIEEKSSFDSNEVKEVHKDLKGVTNINGYFEEEQKFDRFSDPVIDVGTSSFEFKAEKTMDFSKDINDFASYEKQSESGQYGISFLDSNRKANSVQLPWESESGLESVDRDKWRRNKAKLAEKTIPETELRRLRNVSLRMKERIKVGAAGITQALVDRIMDKWKRDEVVKLKFEGAPAFNMKRTHEILESRTGGLVIWRSGSSLVLYRGMAYKLRCVQSYTKLSQAHKNDSGPSKDSMIDVVENGGLNDAARTKESFSTRSSKSAKYPSEEQVDITHLNNLLDELGPRFKDWSGREPLPVDADLLPSVVPGYTPPFRLLPHRVRRGLGNKQMTSYRRLARTLPPHFALGRNRELQGLATAMVKLWKRNAIAKIAIKRGVLNTCNERMAEELRRLTGGTLLSRNKDFIVFYRGNDFLTPPVTEALFEREKLVEVQQEEEEIARARASALLVSNAKASKGPFVAGTLAETIAANSRWGNQPSSEELAKMKRDLALAKHASSVRYLEKKLARAQDKVNKAEKALRKVQEFLKPTELPSDLETISDEERFLFRKVGLSMKAFLLVGRREIFDGTVENMHLHWKHRELVKVIVRGKNFPQVKHIAISLEAESGGLLISVDKTTKGYAIIIYRGKNYQRPRAIRPKNLLTKRQALARSIELQRREALIHHISDLRERIELLKSGLDQMEAGREVGKEFYRRLNNASSYDDDFEDEGEEAYLETYNNGDEEEETPIEKLA